METLTRLVVECMARHGFPNATVRTLYATPAEPEADSRLPLPLSGGAPADANGDSPAPLPSGF